MNTPERLRVLDTFRKVFSLIGRDNPGRWVALVAGAVVASGLEMVGAVLIYLLLALIAAPDGPIDFPLIGDLRQVAGGIEESTFLLFAAAALGVFFLLRAVYFVVFSYVKHRLSQNAAERLSSKLAAGYLEMPYAFHLRRSSSELVRNAHQNVEELANSAFLATMQVIAELLLVVGLLVVMLLIAPGATGAAVLIVGAAAGVLLLVVQPRLRRLGGTAQEMRKRTLASLQQSLYGVREIKVLGVERFFAEAYRSGRQHLARALYLRGTMLELPRLVIETSLVAFILLLFALSVAAGTASEELLSTLGLFAYAGLRIQPSLQKLIGGLNSLRFAGAAIDDVAGDLTAIDDLGDSSYADRLSFEKELRLENVSFAYEGAERPSIRDANLVIRPGEVIGICGPTGGGKTTLTDLIAGVLRPTSGRITVDGLELEGREQAWFPNLGLVPQMGFLIDDTLRRNIALGVEAAEIAEGRLTGAIRSAQLEEFVRSLEAGLDTVVGERGVRVSGGQRQRIAIARALYREPAILIFDEGTSALDNRTESAVMQSLHQLRSHRTIILVAHRLSTVKGSDRIVFVEDGRPVAFDSFDSARRESAGFRAFLTPQG